MNALTFDIDTDSWSNIIHATGKFPAHISVPDHPRWGVNGENKPRPTLGTFVAITGILKSAIQTENKQEIDYFCINMDNIAYLGRPTAPIAKRKGNISCINAHTKHSHSTSTATTQSAPLPKTRFNFNRPKPEKPRANDDEFEEGCSTSTSQATLPSSSTTTHTSRSHSSKK
jgi:hypothetical protein